MWIYLAVVFAGASLWILVATRRERRRQLQLAQSRERLGAEDFVGHFVDEGIQASSARFIWDEFKPFYIEPLTPHPDDRPISEMQIDPECFEDAAERYWNVQGWALPSAKKPIVVPEDPTLLEYGRWLDEQRKHG